MSDDVYEGVDNLEAMAQAKNYNNFLVKMAMQYIPDIDRDKDVVLDFGAGIGTFCKPLHESGYEVLCVEPDTEMRGMLSEYGVRCEKDISCVDDESVSYIYTFNVLEHIENDAEAVNELYRVLKPGGKILAYVPAFQVLYSSMDEKVGHHRRYRKNELKGIHENAGFTIEKSAYVDSLGFFASLAYKWFGGDSGDIDKRSVMLFDRYIFPVGLLLDRLTGKLFGKNVYVVARKPSGDSA